MWLEADSYQMAGCYVFKLLQLRSQASRPHLPDLKNMPGPEQRAVQMTVIPANYLTKLSKARATLTRPHPVRI